MLDEVESQLVFELDIIKQWCDLSNPPEVEVYLERGSDYAILYSSGLDGNIRSNTAIPIAGSKPTAKGFFDEETPPWVLKKYLINKTTDIKELARTLLQN